MKKLRNLCVALSIALMLIGSSGCKKDGLNRDGKLTGKVMIDGAPVSGGEVILYGSDGKHSVSGKIRNDGSYILHEPPVGKCIIVIRTSQLKAIPPRGKAKGPVDHTDPETGEWPIYVEIPGKYEQKDTSDLEVTVTKGNQTHEIKLTRARQ